MASRWPMTVLAAGTIAIFALSTRYLVLWRSPDGHCAVSVGRGQVGVFMFQRDVLINVVKGRELRPSGIYRLGSARGIDWGFVLRHDFRHDDVRMPLWLPAACAVVAASVFWFVSRQRSDDTVPRCAICGYNLTGNVSGVCPECGTPVPPTGNAKREGTF